MAAKVLHGRCRYLSLFFCSGSGKMTSWPKSLSLFSTINYSWMPNRLTILSLLFWGIAVTVPTVTTDFFMFILPFCIVFVYFVILWAVSVRKCLLLIIFLYAIHLFWKLLITILIISYISDDLKEVILNSLIFYVFKIIELYTKFLQLKLLNSPFLLSFFEFLSNDQISTHYCKTM